MSLSKSKSIANAERVEEDAYEKVPPALRSCVDHVRQVIDIVKRSEDHDDAERVATLLAMYAIVHKSIVVTIAETEGEENAQ